jgi:hypothetical protein
VYIKSSDEFNNREEWKSDEGAVHGMLFKSLFRKNPREMELKCSGFARMLGGPWKFNSYTFNTVSKLINDGW